MKMPLHPAALQELLEAVDWYEAREAGLGGDLLDDVEKGVDAILQAPEQWPFFDEEAGIRGYLLSRFPYRLYYRPKGGTWQILAIAHGARQPDYWRGRR